MIIFVIYLVHIDLVSGKDIVSGSSPAIEDEETLMMLKFLLIQVTLIKWGCHGWTVMPTATSSPNGSTNQNAVSLILFIKILY